MPRKIKSSQINENVHNAFKDEIEEIKIACEEDIFFFAQTINPHRVFGEVHQKLLRWLADGNHNKMYLIPRDHQKSFCAAVYVSWIIAREPTATFLYLSATATLAEKQLYLIKNMLESKFFKMFWPDHLLPDSGKRDRWTSHEINIDHPLRSELGIRDCTITTGGINKNIAGLHPKYIILDDVVSPDNAYTEDGREQVKSCYSQLASVESAEGYSIVLGTRYHPDDLYGYLIKMEVDVYNKFGDYIGVDKVYDSFIAEVETDGVFLWPKQKGDDGKEHGFDHQLLAIKKAKYLDRAQFYAQYYNDVNRGFGNNITPELFNYYNPSFIKRFNGRWHFKEKRLNVYAAIDFSYSKRKKADYTAIIVIGIDYHKNIYILDGARFKSYNPNDYINNILVLNAHWGFPRMAAEVTGAQKVIVELIKQTLTENGTMITIDEVRPDRHQGTKEERMNETLRPLYEKGKIWHFKGNVCKELENELIVQYPEHDDLKDVLTVAINKAVAPAPQKDVDYNKSEINFYASGTEDIVSNKIYNRNKIQYHPKFGGVMRRI